MAASVPLLQGLTKDDERVFHALGCLMIFRILQAASAVVIVLRLVSGSFVHETSPRLGTTASELHFTDTTTDGFTKTKGAGDLRPKTSVDLEVKKCDKRATQGSTTVLDRANENFMNSNSIGALLDKTTSVNTRRTLALNLDAFARVDHARQLAATASGIHQMNSRVDLASYLSQFDLTVDPTLTNCCIVDVGSSVEVLPLEWLSRLDAVAYAHSANHARFAFIPDQNAVDSPDANFVELDNGYGRPRVDHIRPHR